MDNFHGLVLPFLVKLKYTLPHVLFPSVDVQTSILIIPHTRLTTFRNPPLWPTFVPQRRL